VSYTLDHLRSFSFVTPNIAHVKFNVSDPGVYKFRDHGSNGQHCPIHRMSGEARVFRHERPSVFISRHDCQGPVYAVVSGTAPFELVTTDGVLNSTTGVIQIDSSVNVTTILQARDAFCTSQLDLSVPKPLLTQVLVTKEEGAAHVEVLASSEPSIVLSYWRTNVSQTGALASSTPARQDAKISVLVREVDSVWRVVRTTKPVPGASGPNRPPGWLPPATHQQLAPELTKELQKLWPDCTVQKENFVFVLFGLKKQEKIDVLE
jgi:hypothetical protein